MKEKEWINKKFQERLNIYKLLQLKGLKDSSLQGRSNWPNQDFKKSKISNAIKNQNRKEKHSWVVLKFKIDFYQLLYVRM
jgi:hypothetical protein